MKMRRRRMTWEFTVKNGGSGGIRKTVRGKDEIMKVKESNGRKRRI